MIRTLGALLLVASAAVSQDNLQWRDSERDASLRNASTHTLNYELDGAATFSAKGKPLTIELRSSGLEVTGEDVSGKLSRHPADRKRFVAEQLNVRGSAVVVSDTEVAQKFLIEKSLLKELTANQQRIRMESEVLNYSGGAEKGTMTIPEKLRLETNSRGVQLVEQPDKSVKNKRFARTVEVKGSSGIVNLYQPVKVSSMALDNGSLEGPVTFVIHISEQLDGAKEPTLSDITGRADRVTFDFKGATKKLVLLGNVHVEGQGDTYSGESNASDMTITLDEALQPTKFEFNGNPATARARQRGGGR